jgi:hypothetical protein
MTATDMIVLKVLTEVTDPPPDYKCLGFEGIAQYTPAVSIAVIRRSCRRLARLGLAEYHKGLWTEDGEPAGAGYCITAKGREAV